jgi:photosystem II stability/assembly factor-like uncharacterized protein/molybdopterin converting factor small subunit
VQVDGDTVSEALASLERTYPRLTGWVLDERGDIREHVSVFVNGERVSGGRALEPDDQLHVLPAISGGAVQTMERPKEALVGTNEEQAELLIGTRKGLVVLRGQRGGPMEVAARRFTGQVTEFAMRDVRTGRYFASVTHGQFGPHLYFTDDPLAEKWEQAEGPAFPEETDTALDRIWLVRRGERDGQLWAGVAPAALFESNDGGRTWELNRGLWDDPTRKEWTPGFGGLAMHSICTWPGDPDKLAVGVSAAGVWITEDGGATWQRGGKGLIPLYMPEEAREDTLSLCVHNMHRAPLEPSTMYMQFHGGVYRSDDAGSTWNDIGLPNGLPSDFGFPAVIDPSDPNSMFVIPLHGAEDRVTVGGNVTVYETRDRGTSWRALTNGLPQGDAYLTILRQAFCHDGRSPLGLYFGAESGEVFGTADGGQTWSTVAEHLPPITSVRCSS